MTKHVSLISSEPERLDRPVDGDIRITSAFPRHELELIVDGQVVSRTTVVDFQQQIGSQTVRMGGIAFVETHKDHRLKGYSRRVMENSLRWMRREGFDTAMLYGIRGFYSKFGYAPAFPEVSFTVAVRDAKAAKPAGYSFVEFHPKYSRAVIRMHHAGNVGRTGPVRRDAKHWNSFSRGIGWPRALCRVALDERGRPAGYFAYDAKPSSLSVIEVGFATPAVFGDVLRAAARLAHHRCLENIRLVLPEDDAFVGYCRPLGMRRETIYRRDGQAMVRMVNIPSALRKVADELASRMSAAGRVTIRTNLDSVTLDWSGGNLTVRKAQPGPNRASMPQWALAQMLYGYNIATSLAAAGLIRGSRQAIDALDTMFPMRPHFAYVPDKF